MYPCMLHINLVTTFLI